MYQKTQFNSSILDQVIGQKLNQLITPQKPKGLLGFVGSQYAQDLGTGLLAQAGYQPMPTSLGQSIGTAFQNANQLRNQRRMADFSELGALANIRESLQSDTTDTDDSWKSIQSYAKARGIDLSETEAKEVTRNIGKGNIIRIDESTGTAINTLDVLLKPYLNRDKSKEDKTDSIPLATGETELEQENVNKKVKEIGDDFARFNWSEAINVAQEVENIVSKKGGIKGIGAGEFLPDKLKGAEGRLNQAVFAKLFNIELKDRSGAAVTDQELERLKKEFNAGFFKTDDDYRRAFEIYKRILNKTISQAVASYDPKALDQWVDNGGVFQVEDKQKQKEKYGF